MGVKVEAIDLFCGIGGFTYGLGQAGIDVTAGLDSDASCKYAYEKNNGAQFIEADVSEYDFEQLRSFYSKGSIRVLVGCAPCQPFSTHTHKIKSKLKDTRWNLVKYFTEAVKVLNPDIISMENVRGITKEDVFAQFLQDLKQLKYQVDYKIVYCPDYGIPQNRYRLVLVGSKQGKNGICMPRKTHKKDAYITVSDVIGHLPPIRSGETDKNDPLHRAKNLAKINLTRIKRSKPNGTWHDWDKNLLPNCYKKESGKTYTSVYGRMDWDTPSPTITTQFFNYGSGRFGHPEQNRALSIREGALLQTFPKGYDFGEAAALDRLGRHIGNAVPPQLGKAIGTTIKRHIEKYLILVYERQVMGRKYKFCL